MPTPPAAMGWGGLNLLAKLLHDGWKAARSRHPGGANVLFGDGSVHFAKNSVNPAVWAATGSRAGGEVAALDQ